MNDKYKSFEYIYGEYKSRFIVFAKCYVKDKVVAEDIVSDAFTVLLENIETFSADSNIPAFLFQLIKNKCVDYLRHVHVEEYYSSKYKDYVNWDIQSKIDSLESCVPSEIYSKEIDAILKDSINKLPQKTKEVFVLSRIKHMTNKEISAVCKISIKTVEYHIHKAILHLRESLEDYF